MPPIAAMIAFAQRRVAGHVRRTLLYVDQGATIRMIPNELVSLLSDCTDVILLDRTVIFLRARNKSSGILGNSTPAVVDRFLQRVLACAQAQALGLPDQVGPADGGDYIIASEVARSLSNWERSNPRGAEAWELAINLYLLPRVP